MKVVNKAKLLFNKVELLGHGLNSLVLTIKNDQEACEANAESMLNFLLDLS